NHELTNSKWTVFTHSMVGPLRLSAQLSFAVEHPFQGGQAFKPDRASRVEPIGRYTDLCSETIFETIRKAGGQIHVNRAGIDFPLEAIGSPDVLRDDRFGMLRTIAFDVLHRLVYIIHNTNG